MKDRERERESEKEKERTDPDGESDRETRVIHTSLSYTRSLYEKLGPFLIHWEMTCNTHTMITVPMSHTVEHRHSDVVIRRFLCLTLHNEALLVLPQHIT